MSILSDKINKFPLKPGVYRFIGKFDKILYIGRATNLRRRLAQYFQRSSDPRISEMVSLAKDVKYQETDTLLEAVILEANLIKKYWPKYNVKDKDDRSFIYIVIDTKADFPKPVIMRGRTIFRRVDVRGAKIFGPYQSLTIVKNALKIIRRVFPYSTCLPAGRRANLFSGKPCFDFQVGLCPGACVGAISREDYQKNINDMVLLLGGRKKQLLKKLKKENPEQIKALQHIQDVTLISESEISNQQVDKIYRIEGYDISHLAGKETYGSMVVIKNGKPNKEEYRLFKIKEAPANDDLRALEEMLLRRFKHPEWQNPDLIMIDGGKPQVDFIYKTLQKEHINIPIVGISKFQHDKLVFPGRSKKATKETAAILKDTLIKARDEAHRFALKVSRRARKIRLQ